MRTIARDNQFGFPAVNFMAMSRTMDREWTIFLAFSQQKDGRDKPDTLPPDKRTTITTITRSGQFFPLISSLYSDNLVRKSLRNATWFSKYYYQSHVAACNYQTTKLASSLFLQFSIIYRCVKCAKVPIEFGRSTALFYLLNSKRMLQNCQISACAHSRKSVLHCISSSIFYHENHK